VIDEGSMPPRALCDYILNVVAVENPSLRILIVGDFVQLPPVGEDSSPMLELAYDLPPARFAQLKEVVRYDSELLTVATRLRKEHERLVADNKVSPRSNASFFVRDLPPLSEERKIYRDQAAFEKAIISFTERRGLKGFERNRIVAWRNATVDRYANLVRTTLGFNSAFEKGELVTLKSPLIEMRYDTEKRRMIKKIVAAIDSACTVVDVLHEPFTLSIPSLRMQQRINTYNVLLKGEVSKRVRTVDPSDATLDNFLADAGRAFNKVKQSGGRPKWDEFYELKESFLRLRYAYAGTAHRMQGSTLARAFIDVQDITLNRKPVEMIQCLYVASTRCTRMIHVLC
jgi:ATP-dependent exoDNAse (exonuclease V) alpha subunit